ncbi:hypothetical protein Hanom_Chr05g00397561 [Helianthus anomalus]
MALTWATGVRFGRTTRRNERENELHLAANAYGGLGHRSGQKKNAYFHYLFAFLCFLNYFGLFVLGRVFGPLSFLGLFQISVSKYMILYYDPSLLLFRRFFRLAKIGDWFTFETSKVDTCLISCMVTTFAAWKDRFFWVLDSIVPFKMVWRHPDFVLNEPEPSESDLNDCFLTDIRQCPSRFWPFPKHLLVWLGISKLWDKPDRDPVLMRSGLVMSALDFVKSDDTSDVVFTNAQAAKGDDAVAKGSEQRFEDVRYVSVLNVKGFTKTATPKALTHRSACRLKSAAQSTSSNPMDLSDDIEVSEGQGPDVEKEKNLVVLGKKKASGKKITVTLIQGSSRKYVEGLNEHEVYVPNWSVKVGDNFKDARVCADVLANFSPPGV